VKLEFSRPGKPTDNAFIESFNGRLRQECLNQNWIVSLADAKETIEECKRISFPQLAGPTNPDEFVSYWQQTGTDPKAAFFNSPNGPIIGEVSSAPHVLSFGSKI
jgi:transposase InsO family protein